MVNSTFFHLAPMKDMLLYYLSPHLFDALHIPLNSDSTFIDYSPAKDDLLTRFDGYFMFDDRVTWHRMRKRERGGSSSSLTRISGRRREGT